MTSLRVSKHLTLLSRTSFQTLSASQLIRRCDGRSGGQFGSYTSRYCRDTSLRGSDIHRLIWRNSLGNIFSLACHEGRSETGPASGKMIYTQSLMLAMPSQIYIQVGLHSRCLSDSQPAALHRRSLPYTTRCKSVVLSFRAYLPRRSWLHYFL